MANPTGKNQYTGPGGHIPDSVKPYLKPENHDLLYHAYSNEKGQKVLSNETSHGIARVILRATQPGVHTAMLLKSGVTHVAPGEGLPGTSNRGHKLQPIHGK